MPMEVVISSRDAAGTTAYVVEDSAMVRAVKVVCFNIKLQACVVEFLG